MTSFILWLSLKKKKQNKKFLAVCLAMVILKKNKILFRNIFEMSFAVESIFEISLKCLILKGCFLILGRPRVNACR